MRDLKHLIYFENLLQQANNDLVQDACKDGRLALAWNCSYIPEVLLDTDNCFGVRLRAPNCTNPDMATYYMTNRSCPYSKSILERAFEGGYNFISALIGQECCTTMNRMEQYFEYCELIPNDKFFCTYLDMPLRKTEWHAGYYRRQIEQKIIQPLEKVYGVDFSEEKLRKAVEQFNEVCRIITEMNAMRMADNPVITGYEFHVIQLCTLTCPKDLILPYLRETLQELRERQPDPKPWYRARILIAGSEIDDPEFTKMLEMAGGMVVADRYCFGSMPGREEIPLEELMFSQDFGFLARNLEQSVNLYRMSIGADGTEQMELVVGEPTEMFPAGGILCKRSGFGDYENQYFWQSKVFDGKLFLGTFDTSSLLEPLGQFTNGDLLHMSRDEWASQIGYLKVLLQLLLNKNTGDGTLLAADADTDAAIDAAVDAVNEEADSPETFSLTDAQYDTLRQGIDDGAYAAAYSVSTLGSLRRLNSLLAKLTDLVETNDIAGFVDIYQQACDLYSGISDKLPEALKKLYDALVRITELENMKDLVICLNKLSTATRGFGLYTITSENGKLTLDTLTRDGFGDPFNHGLRAFAVNDEQGWMVIGTANPFMGTQLWRTTVDMTDPMDRFTDLDPNGWAYPSIEYCVRHGLMSGMSDTIFSPNTVTTRAQLVQVLYNLEGKPDVSDVAVPFTDAASGWYRDAVAWAYKTGVVDGMSPTTFAPNNTVTREQVAVILMRYLTKVCGVERTWTPDDLSGFADGGNVSGWARAGMADAVALGLFGGTQDSSGQVWLRPGAGTTRAETAALLQRMCTKVLGIG